MRGRADGCRLITVIKYRWQVVYIRAVLTHDEYGREKWKL
jgi:mRNA-degrading endonuclease HigB of HigAB toxin-antitoxin module